MEGRWFLLQNGLWLVEKQMPFYQPCIIVVLWRYKYGKIGDCKDNDDSEEFRPFLGDVSFYFSISFGFVWCKWFSSAKMCLNHTRTLHTDSLPTMIPPSYDHHLGILKKMRDFDKKKKYIQRKIFQDPLQRQSAISCWSISWLMANRFFWELFFTVTKSLQNGITCHL